MFREFVDNCVAHIDSFWEAMLGYIEGVSSVVGGLCGLAALLYIGSRVWSSYARGEALDIYPLLRPFAIGLLCTQFNLVVVGGIRGLADPICEYFAGLEAQTGQMDVTAEYVAALEAAQRKAASMQEEVDGMEAGEEDREGRFERFIRRIVSDIRNRIFVLIAWLFGFLADLFASLTKFVLMFTRSFSLSVLCVMGPVIFAGSIFPGFKQGIVQWIARFVCLYMWVPLFHLCEIFLNTVKLAIGSQMVGKVQAMVDSVQLEAADPSMLTDMAMRLEGISANLSLIGALLSILAAALYKSVPILASWLIAGGDASGNLSSVASFANTTVAIVGAGAAMATRQGLGAGAALARNAGGRLGAAMAKKGEKIKGSGSQEDGIGQGSQDGGASAQASSGAGGVGRGSMGEGPEEARRPVGFRMQGGQGQEGTEGFRFPGVVGGNGDAKADAGLDGSPGFLAGGGDLAAPESGSGAVPSGDTRTERSERLRRKLGQGMIDVGRRMRAPKLNHAMRTGDAWQRLLAAQDKYATEGVLRRALLDENPYVQLAAVSNENVTNSLLRMAVRYGRRDVADSAAEKLRERGVEDF